MEKYPVRWLAVALVILLGALLLTTYSTSSRPEELLLFHGRVKELFRCPPGTFCQTASASAVGREWHVAVQPAPLDVSKLEAGSITWTSEAADAIIAEVEKVQFPESCKNARWLAIQQLSDDILYDYQNFLALLVFGVSLGYTVVPIHDSPMAPYATCKEKSLHCYFRPFTNCSFYSEPGRLKEYGDAFYDYTHGRDFLHHNMGKVLAGDWGDRDLLIIPYEAHYPNERPYREEWLSSLWERLSAAGLASVVGGGDASPEHVEAMVFSVVSDWMFKPVGRIQDIAVEILHQQKQMKQPVLGVLMPTRFEGGPERFEGADQVDVLAYDGKKMKRVLKDLKWAYKAGLDNVGHYWNSTFFVTDSDYLLEEVLQKPESIGAVSADRILFDKLEADDLRATGPIRRVLEGRGSSPGSLTRGRKLHAKVGLQAPGRSLVDERSSGVGSFLAEEIEGRPFEMLDKAEHNKSIALGNREESGHVRQRYSRSSQTRKHSKQDMVRGIATSWWPFSDRLDNLESPSADGSRPESSMQGRRKLLQTSSQSDNQADPLKERLHEEALDEENLIGPPESGQDWSALEDLRASEDRALANTLVLARLSDYAILSSRSNVGRLVAQVLSAHKRATQIGPLGPVVHSTVGGDLVRPLSASTRPRLPLGALRWSNVAEKLVYEELDRTQFPQDCEQARLLVVKLNTQGLALNFHSSQMALVLATSLGRTLVIEPSEAAQPEADTCVVETLETLFEPLSGCEYSTVSGDDVTLSWDDAMMTFSEARVVWLESVVPNQPGFADRGEVWVEPTWWAAFLDNLITAGNLRLEGGGEVRAAPFLDLHFVLWSITTQWMWRPQQRILQIVDAIKCAWPDRTGPTVAVHIRQTDRGWGDGYYREHRRYRDIVEYGRAIESLEADWGIRWPSVFLFSDTASVLRQASANVSRLGFSYPERQVMYNPLVELDPITVHTSHLNVPCRQRNQILQHYVAEITVAAETADYAVFAGSASGARIVWELMAAHRQFAQTTAQGDLVHSLDTGWYYEW